jgi:hypothetical protein
MPNDQPHQDYKNVETWTIAYCINNNLAVHERWQLRLADAFREAAEEEPVKNGTWTTEQAARFRLATQLQDEFEVSVRRGT